MTPVVLAVITAPPFAESTRAQGATHMLGPAFPIRVDANGSGGPGPGDESIVPTLSGTQLTIPSRWVCDSENRNVLTLSNPGGSGQFQTASRMNGALQQSVTITSIVGGGPREFSYSQTNTVNSSTRTGGASLVDMGGDGVMDLLTIHGSVSGTVSFTYVGNSEYISIPWSQASVLGVDFSATCGGSQPQIWIPLADTNGDGAGDAIVLDLDGNGLPDPQFFQSPPLAAPPAPSMGPIARGILIALLGIMASWFLSRRRPDIGPAAA